jgi:hypothetical protein
VKLTAVHRRSLTKISFGMTERDSCATPRVPDDAPAYRGEVRQLCEQGEDAVLQKYGSGAFGG